MGLGGICFTEIGKRSLFREEVRRKSCDLCVCPDHKRTAVELFIESGLECVFGSYRTGALCTSECEDDMFKHLTLTMNCHYTSCTMNRELEITF